MYVTVWEKQTRTRIPQDLVCWNYYDYRIEHDISFLYV